MKNITLTIITAFAMNISAFAANVATDNASTNNYPGGTWNSGSNGGNGFGAWTLTSTPAGGFSGSYIGGTALGTTTFGIYSGGNTAATFLAYRPFTGAMVQNDRFSVDLAHSPNINTGGQIGLSLMEGSNARWTLKFVGGGTDWQINDGGSSDFGAGQAYAANTLLSFSFTYNGSSSYSYTFGTGSGNNFTATANIAGITGVQFFSVNQGNDQNFAFNNLAVPEPSSASLMALGTAGLLALRRRRNA